MRVSRLLARYGLSYIVLGFLAFSSVDSKASSLGAAPETTSQDLAESAPDSSTDPPAPSVVEKIGLVPPELIEDAPAAYPEELRGQPVFGVVTLQIVVDETGLVRETKLAKGAHPLLDAAATKAAAKLRFRPATMDGKPIVVEIFFSYRFEQSSEQQIAQQSTQEGVLVGQVIDRKTRRPIPNALVISESNSVEADLDGHFSLKLPEGRREVRVKAPGYEELLFHETIRSSELLQVSYAIEVSDGNPYETTVRAERFRSEVSRVTLRESELREVPGTMGDPFRVIMLLPGVSSVMSGVAYPVVRGSAPAATGYYLDGVRVPILFHLLLGPAVIHPDFIESIDFFPGAPPPKYGRLLGGVIDGKPSKPGDQLKMSAYFDLINAGGFVDAPINSAGLKITIAGRYSYTAWIATLVAEKVLENSDEKLVLNFWDYQVRAEKQLGSASLRLFAFGSSDEAGSEAKDSSGTSQIESVRFHRIDLRLNQPTGVGPLEFGLTWGSDEVGFENGRANQIYVDSSGIVSERVEQRFQISEKIYSARLSWDAALGATLRFKIGTELEQKRAGLEYSSAGLLSGAQEAVEPLAIGTFWGLWSQLVWQSESGCWSVVPGLRFDNYHAFPGIDHSVAEPRLLIRLKPQESVVLKLAGGLFHQEPTTLISIPAADIVALRWGLQRGIQIDAGVEWKIFSGLELAADVYYNPLLRTLEYSPFDSSPIGSSEPKNSSQQSLSDLVSRGRAYGFELMIRHPLGGNWFGWLSYSLQRSTRWITYTRYDGYGRPIGAAVSGYMPYAFDQTHNFNAVLSYRFFDHWTFGATFHFNTGRPETGGTTSWTMREKPSSTEPSARWWVPASRDSADRLPAFWRVDLRLARSWAFDSMKLELYLDVLNVTLNNEIIGYEYNMDGTSYSKVAAKIPVVLPILGFKGAY